MTILQILLMIVIIAILGIGFLNAYMPSKQIRYCDKCGRYKTYKFIKSKILVDDYTHTVVPEHTYKCSNCGHEKVIKRYIAD